MRLAGKIAVVTGAASGIGKATAFSFVAEGAAVLIADLDAVKAEQVCNDLVGKGGRAVPVVADVADGKDVDRLFAETLSHFGGVDILVNNAGIIHQAAVLNTREEDWDRILRNNLKSCFLCSKAAARIMVDQGRGGRIINISSIHAAVSEPEACAYTAAKGGMEAFSRTLATELAPHKITVNCVEPGATYTELTVPMYTESVTKALHQRIPLGEIAQPQWIASGIVFLASDEARYMTGQVLVLDGGYIMDGSLPGAKYWTE